MESRLTADSSDADNDPYAYDISDQLEDIIKKHYREFYEYNTKCNNDEKSKIFKSTIENLVKKITYEKEFD